MSMERVAALILTKPLEQYSSNTREVLMNSVSSAVFEIKVAIKKSFGGLQFNLPSFKWVFLTVSMCF